MVVRWLDVGQGFALRIMVLKVKIVVGNKLSDFSFLVELEILAYNTCLTKYTLRDINAQRTHINARINTYYRGSPVQSRSIYKCRELIPYVQCIISFIGGLT